MEVCTICYDNLLDPIECDQCTCICCRECISEWFQQYDKISCPQCLKIFSFGILSLDELLEDAIKNYLYGRDQDGVELKKIQDLVQKKAIEDGIKEQIVLEQERMEELYVQNYFLYDDGGFDDYYPEYEEYRDSITEEYGPVEDKIQIQISKEKGKKKKGRGPGVFFLKKRKKR